MLTRHPDFLRYVLFADAVASGATGALMIAGAGFLSGLLAIPGELLFEAGLLLVPYVLFVLWTATRRTIPVAPVWLIIAGNALWTLGSIVVLLGWLAPNALGHGFVIFQAAAVGLFGLLQFVGLGHRAVAA
ncbi:hypothetical protein G5V57_11350 [Nordella sp. HKS 07]|uniref:hypothetical protein n=1 Tax=Nordella sp. HKS 07 TaxID=2712222 RepID=UPI0013E1995E|nr:hypothetical protein [Nordella sp. HKS 07]QIG48268.1 hypothetical protein G5V57_11350 [Nordella sp. HKS 07]